MDEINSKGLVVSAADIGDNDRLLTIVTEDHGKVLATVKGGKSLRNKFISVSEPFIYASFGLRRTSKYYFVYDAELIDDFYPIREDLVKMALASYICDVASELSLEGMADAAILKLTVNALYALSYKQYDHRFIKAAFEFKAAVIAGFMPEVSECTVCGREPEDESFLDAVEGSLICSDCMTLPMEKTGLKSTSIILPVAKNTLSALRFIEGAPIQRFLSFKLSGDENLFYNLCEKYLTCHLEKELYTLSFYKSIL